MNEIWKVYKRTHNNRWGTIKWEVSNYGNVKKNGEPYECPLSISGYKTIPGEFLHRVVAELFIGPKPGPKYEIDHIDTNKLNNHVDNLRWVTRKENLNNPKTRQHNSEAQKGKKHTDETKQKMGEGVKKRWDDPEYRRKMIESRSGENHPLYGKHHTDETKQKLSENHADVSGKNNPCYGKKLMNNGITQKYIPKDEVEMYLEQGWKLGKLHK